MQVKLEQLHWSPNTRTLSAEASDLGITAGHPLPYGITVEGETRSPRFLNPQPERDGEGEVLAWTYTSHTTPVRLVLFND